MNCYNSALIKQSTSARLTQETAAFMAAEINPTYI